MKKSRNRVERVYILLNKKHNEIDFNDYLNIVCEIITFNNCKYNIDSILSSFFDKILKSNNTKFNKDTLSLLVFYLVISNLIYIKVIKKKYVELTVDKLLLIELIYL